MAYKTVVNKTMYYMHKDRPIDQWSRIENMETDLGTILEVKK